MLDEMHQDHFDNHGHIKSCWAKKSVSKCQDITEWDCTERTYHERPTCPQNGKSGLGCDSREVEVSTPSCRVTNLNPWNSEGLA